MSGSLGNRPGRWIERDATCLRSAQTRDKKGRRTPAQGTNSSKTGPHRHKWYKDEVKVMIFFYYLSKNTL